jgi:hypothetical protein
MKPSVDGDNYQIQPNTAQFMSMRDRKGDDPATLIKLEPIAANPDLMARNFPERLASAVLASKGSIAIRQIRIAAVSAYRSGRLDTAATLRRMAEAADREYLASTPYFETGF